MVHQLRATNRGMLIFALRTFCSQQRCNLPLANSIRHLEQPIILALCQVERTIVHLDSFVIYIIGPIPKNSSREKSVLLG
jgi:hypothetical protein